MTALREFAFFMQGYFEINGDIAPIGPRQIEAIDKKLQRLELSEGTAPKLLEFVGMVKGVLPLLKDQNLPREMHDQITKQIKDQLNDVFVHAIDPTIKGDQQGLRAIHKGKRDIPDGSEAMC